MNLTVSESQHPVVNLALAPIWGLAFLMFLPLVGFYLTAQAILKPLFSGLPHPLASPATGAAYLTGTEGKSHLDAPVAPETLGALSDEVAQRRAGQAQKQ